MRPRQNRQNDRWWLLAWTVGCLSAIFDYPMFAGALEVTTPALGDKVIAESIYTVEWIPTEASHRRFDIDMYYCGSSCTKSYCGEFVASLCPDDGCPDSAGDYDVKFPEPAGGLSSDGYVVRVADTEDESDVGCSDEWRLVASKEVPLEGEHGEPVLGVVLPSRGDDVVAGDEYTVKFAYDNGLGPSAGRFSIDLYDSGSCGKGTPAAVLCDKPDVGCRSEDGDYDITIPSDLSGGMYAIRVAVFDKGSPADCSDSFRVLASGTPIGDSTSSDDDDGDAGATDDGTNDPSPAPSTVPSGEEGSCSHVEVEVASDATSDYSGTYNELGTASGRPRFVREDNVAVLQSVKSGRRQLWMLTGLETTFSVVSDVDHPADVECKKGSDCWLEETESGPVSTTAEISCVDDPEPSVASSFAAQEVSSTTSTSAVDDDATGGSCSHVEVEVASDATSDYSGTYNELGTASGRPRFVREDNVAVLQSVKSGRRQLWMLTGLETTFSVVSDANHPVDITCSRPSNCWKEQTESGQVVSSAEMSCTEATK